ncbi:MAG: class II fructose-bisphosphatase [Deltaproteobacteria bacterium]|nr:class II fructose-bisphosphatase [Deltaproteobacteria bacterium]
MERNLALELARVTEAAALSCARWMGRGDKHAADDAATEAMRRTLQSIPFTGRVVIGEGEMDEAPMLYIGEIVGNGKGELQVDIAVDPLEGTNLCATGMPNAIATIAVANRGCFLHAPDMYMDKICVGAEAKGAIDIRKPPAQNIGNVADALGLYPEHMTVVILNRDRHKELIDEVRSTGARIKLIPDGDVAPAVAAGLPESPVHMLIGIGGGPEGVLAAAALKCLGGDMQGTLHFTSEEERRRCRQMGIEDLEQVYGIDDLAKGDVMFAATGVTDGDLLKGVRYFKGGGYTHSIVMRSLSRTVRYITTEHHFDYKPVY